jgi:multimeric flavodoxin WrbA
LNGSPKGEKSVTFQYVRYVMHRFSQHEYDVIHVTQQIDALLSSASLFDETMSRIGRADLIIWAVPVYYLMVPSQYKRFIEQVHLRQAMGVFVHKYALGILSSTHLFDHLAMRYLQACSEDLGMSYVGSFSAEMFDLLQEQYQRSLVAFMANAFDMVQSRAVLARGSSQLQTPAFDYRPQPAVEKIPLQEKRVLLISDSVDDSDSLTRMINRLKDSWSGSIEVVNLNFVDIQGGCLGTVQCFSRHSCPSYDDGFVKFYTQQVMKADLLVFAGRIKDRHLSSLWKRYYDRSMFHGHVPSLAGKQIAWIVSGPLRQIPEVKEFMQAAAEIQMANLAGVVTDEDADSLRIDAELQLLAKRMVSFSAQGCVLPPTFLGIGGMHVCRHIVIRNRSLFSADYPFHRKGLGYHLAPNNWKLRLLNLVLVTLSKIPACRRYIESKVEGFLLKPFQKLFR